MIFSILDNNALTGPIPSELGLCTNLAFLELSKSFLVILLVTLVLRIYTHLPGRSFFILVENALTGPIPSELGLLSELTRLDLGKSFLVILLV